MYGRQQDQDLKDCEKKQGAFVQVDKHISKEAKASLQGKNLTSYVQ